MPHPTRVTFPGTVRFADPALGQALRQVRNYRTKKLPNGREVRGDFTGTTVTVPHGQRAEYTVVENLTQTRPTFLVTLVDDAPAPVIHASLEHETKEVITKVVVRKAKKPGEKDVTKDKVSLIATGKVTATSLVHEGVAGEGTGPNAAEEALKNMHAAIEVRVAAKKKLEAEKAAKDKPERAPPAPTEPEPLDHQGEPGEKDPVVTREG